MDGKDKKEHKERMIAVKALASNIRNSPLDRQDAEIIYRERWVNSIGYCLRVTQFSNAQCEEIMKPFYMAMLPKMGFNRHIPLEVRYGPKKFNGKGLVHLATHQHAKHLEDFVAELRADTHLGKALRMEMDKYQLYLGSYTHFLTRNSNEFAYKETCRIQYLWEANSKYGITLHIPGAWVPSPQREHDQSVMDLFRAHETDSVKLERLNDVRLYLHVTNVSCMTNAEGYKVERWALFGPPKNSALDWPARLKPLAENLKMWREMIYQNITAATGLYPHNLGEYLQATCRPLLPTVPWEQANARIDGLDP